MADAEMDYKTALDHANAYHAKMVKPFERLADVLRAATRAESELASMVKERDAAQAARDRYRAEHDAERTSLDTELQNRKRAVAAELAALNETVRTAQREASELRIRLTDERHQLQSAHDDVLRRLQRDKDTLLAEVQAATAAVQAEHAKAQAAYAEFRAAVGLT
jgi:chromosome segregation ATPase